MRPNISIVTYDLDGRFIRKTTKLAKAISTSDFSFGNGKKQSCCEENHFWASDVQKYPSNNAKCKNAKIPVQQCKIAKMPAQQCKVQKCKNAKFLCNNAKFKNAKMQKCLRNNAK